MRGRRVTTTLVDMDCVLQFLFWIALTTTTASRYNGQLYYNPYDEDYPQTTTRNDGSYKIMNLQKTYPSISNRQGQEVNETSRDGLVVFPGPVSKPKDFVPVISDECKRIGICDSVPNYPREMIAALIAKTNDTSRFNVDELETPEIAQRIGPAEENLELCSFRQKIFYPKSAQNKDGEWFFIVNNDERPVQGFRVEICKSDGDQCDKTIVYFRNGFTASCKQKFVHRTMVAIDRNGKISYDQPFKVPGCCSCVARTKK